MSATAESNPSLHDDGPTIAVVFHVDLTGIENADACTVHAAEADLPLQPHTPETLAAAIAAAPTLAARGRRPTHYTAQAAALPADRALHVTVYRSTPQYPWEESFVFFGVHHPPIGEMLADVLARGTVLTQKIDYISTAESLLSTHPNVLTWDGDASSAVGNILTTEPIAQYVNQLAELLESYGPPDTSSGWAQLTQFKPDNPVFNNKSVGWPQVIPDVTNSQYMKQATAALLQAAKNCAQLKNKLWRVTPGAAVVPQPASLSPSAATATGDDWTPAISDPQEIHGVQISATAANAALRQVQLTINNYFIRTLSIYVRFYDVSDNVVPIALATAYDEILVSTSDGPSPVEVQLINEIGIFQASNAPYVGHVPPVLTAMGLPVVESPGTLNLTLQFPAGATSMKIYCCSLGTGSNPEPAMPALGGLLTGLMSLGIPALMFAAAVRDPLQRKTEQAASEVLQSPLFRGFIRVVGVALVADTVKQCVVGQANMASLSNTAQFLFQEPFAPVMEIILGLITTESILKAVPIIGTIFAVASVIADAIQVLWATIDILTSNWRIENTVNVTITSTVTVNPDPRLQAFPDNGTSCVVNMIYQDSRATSDQTIPIASDSTPRATSDQASDSTPATLTATLSNTLGGMVKFEADFYIGTWIAAKATSGWLTNNQANASSVALYLVQTPVPLSSLSVYSVAQLLTYQPSLQQYQWKTVSAESSITYASHSNSSTGNSISRWVGIVLSQRAASLGYAWMAAGMGIGDTTSGVDGQLYAMQNVNIPGVPMNMLKFPPSGFSDPTALIYDSYPPKFLMDKTTGQWVLNPVTNLPEPDPSDPPLGYFYIDPRKATNDFGADGGYHLRQVVLDNTTPFDMSAGQLSFGRFPTFPTSVAMHPSGAVVGVDASSNVLYILKGSMQAVDDSQALMSRFHGGTAQTAVREGLLSNPVAVACSYDGTIYVLENNPGGVVPTRLQAFDIKGNPVPRFAASDGGNSAFLPLTSTGINYLSLAVVGSQDLTYLYVLGYANDGYSVSDYAMTIYSVDSAGAISTLVTTPGLNAAAIVVDMWHSLYALDWAMTSDGEGHLAGPEIQSGSHYLGPHGRTVPSISLWLPPVP